MAARIKKICAHEILASGGYPTVEAIVELESGANGIASVPYGASAGSHEATVLTDDDKKRYNGHGVLTATATINKTIAPALIGTNADEQRQIDTLMIAADGTATKNKLGGNSILAVSLAVAKAAARDNHVPLYQHIRDIYSLPLKNYYLPNPMVVVIEGGKHADDTTDLQEYLISAIGRDSARENIRIAIESYMALKQILKQEGLSTNVGNEGAFAPNGIPGNEAPFAYITKAIEAAGYTPGIDAGISIDAAASEFFENGMYHLRIDNKSLTPEELMSYYLPWFTKYPLVTIEDMLHEDDWEHWPILTSQAAAAHIPNIGDDLTVTNGKRLQKAIDLKAINAILIKLNQIGSLTETVDCCMLARQHGMFTVPSHRGGGETNDTSMVDLAVAVNAAFIKVGPTRGERVAKYNRLMAIEEELGNKAAPQGKDFRIIR
jgi:enolase